MNKKEHMAYAAKYMAAQRACQEELNSMLRNAHLVDMEWLYATLLRVKADLANVAAARAAPLVAEADAALKKPYWIPDCDCGMGGECCKESGRWVQR